MIPNVLAARYASPELVAHLVAGGEGTRRAPALARRAARPAGPRRRGAGRRGRGVRAGARPGRPGLDRGPGAGHPARREGADRGVLRARRARAHPQGNDLAGPDRERRAAADPRARWSWSGTGWWRRWPGWPGGRRARRPGAWSAARTTCRRRPPRWASASPRAAEELLHRVRAARATCSTRYPLRGIKGPVGTAADQLDLLGGDAGEGWPSWSGGSPRTSASAGCSTASARSTRGRWTSTWCPRWCRPPRRRRRWPPRSG